MVLASSARHNDLSIAMPINKKPPEDAIAAPSMNMPGAYAS